MMGSKTQVEGLVEVGLEAEGVAAASAAGPARLVSPRHLSHPQNQGQEQPQSSSSSPYKGPLLKADVHAKIQGIAITASGALLRWVKGMHCHVSPPKPAAAAAAKKQAAAAAAMKKEPSPIVPHDASLTIGRFRFLGDRLEDWEDPEQEQEQDDAVAATLSGGGGASHVARPHARWEVEVRDIGVSSTAAPLVASEHPPLHAGAADTSAEASATTDGHPRRPPPKPPRIRRSV